MCTSLRLAPSSRVCCGDDVTLRLCKMWTSRDRSRKRAYRASDTFQPTHFGSIFGAFIIILQLKVLEKGGNQGIAPQSLILSL